MASRMLLGTSATEYCLRFMEAPAALDWRTVSVSAATNVHEDTLLMSGQQRAASTFTHHREAYAKLDRDQRLLCATNAQRPTLSSRRAPNTQTIGPVASDDG